MYKYRILTGQNIAFIQVKKWYGWVTIKVIEGETSTMLAYEILELLNDD